MRTLLAFATLVAVAYGITSNYNYLTVGDFDINLTSDFTDGDRFVVNGGASVSSASTVSVASDGSSPGSVFGKSNIVSGEYSRIRFGFQASFTFTATAGAEGFAWVAQTVSENFLGDDGRSLGVYSDPVEANVISVEFDAVATGDEATIGAHHGQVCHGADCSEMFPLGVTVDSGSPVPVVITWFADSLNFTVEVDGNVVLERQMDFDCMGYLPDGGSALNGFHGGEAYTGFTASTDATPGAEVTVSNYVLKGLSELHMDFERNGRYQAGHHHDGGVAPPMYGLRLYGLISSRTWTFDFEHDAALTHPDGPVFVDYHAESGNATYDGMVCGGIDNGSWYKPGSEICCHLHLHWAGPGHEYSATYKSYAPNGVAGHLSCPALDGYHAEPVVYSLNGRNNNAYFKRNHRSAWNTQGRWGAAGWLRHNGTRNSHTRDSLFTLQPCSGQSTCHTGFPIGTCLVGNQAPGGGTGEGGGCVVDCGGGGGNEGGDDQIDEGEGGQAATEQAPIPIVPLVALIIFIFIVLSVIVGMAVAYRRGRFLGLAMRRKREEEEKARQSRAQEEAQIQAISAAAMANAADDNTVPFEEQMEPGANGGDGAAAPSEASLDAPVAAAAVGGAAAAAALMSRQTTDPELDRVDSFYEEEFPAGVAAAGTGAKHKDSFYEADFDGGNAAAVAAAASLAGAMAAGGSTSGDVSLEADSVAAASMMAIGGAAAAAGAAAADDGHDSDDSLTGDSPREYAFTTVDSVRNERLDAAVKLAANLSPSAAMKLAMSKVEKVYNAQDDVDEAPGNEPQELDGPGRAPPDAGAGVGKTEDQGAGGAIRSRKMSTGGYPEYDPEPEQRRSVVFPKGKELPRTESVKKWPQIPSAALSTSTRPNLRGAGQKSMDLPGTGESPGPSPRS